MPSRRPFARFLLGAGGSCAAVLVLVGGVILRGSGLIAVLLAGAVTACLTAGMAREAPAPRRVQPLEAGVQAAGWTVGVLLGLAGLAALGGGVVAVLAVVAGGVVALLVWLLRTGARGAIRPAGGQTHPVSPPRPVAAGSTVPATPGSHVDAAGAARLLPPVPDLSTAALGREWLLSTAALAARLDPVAREAVVRRRQETLDELERRDPEGFARWLAAGPLPGSDPATFVRGNNRTGPGRS
jgi:hypothetical protein